MDFCDILSFRVLVDLHFDSCLLQLCRVIVRELAINVFGIVLLQRLVVKLCVGFLSCGDTNRRVITVLCLIARHGKTEHVVLAFNDFCIVDYHIANNDIEPCKAVAVFRRIFHRILRRDFLRRCNLKLLLENAAFICGQKRFIDVSSAICGQRVSNVDKTSLLCALLRHFHIQAVFTLVDGDTVHRESIVKRCRADRHGAVDGLCQRRNGEFGNGSVGVFRHRRA